VITSCFGVWSSIRLGGHPVSVRGSGANGDGCVGSWEHRVDLSKAEVRLHFTNGGCMNSDIFTSRRADMEPAKNVMVFYV
jgi:hypothetical protein